MEYFEIATITTAKYYFDLQPIFDEHIGKSHIAH